jgi:uncharacterized protein YjiS (DUF1127 family)
MSDLMTTRFTQARHPVGQVVRGHPIAALHLALRTYWTRQALPELTARELADIGLTRDAAMAEAARLPWDTKPRARRGTIGRIQQALERARTRRLLARLQARELSDIGIGRAEQQTEASKPMWRG